MDLSCKFIAFCLPSGNTVWIIADLSFDVVDFAGFTAQQTFVLSVQANIESLAIGVMGKFRMNNCLALGINTLVLFERTLERIIEII